MSAGPDKQDDSNRGGADHAALVFGREESGLSAEEVSACSHCCAIPAGELQPSLNLSHAVVVVLAQLFEQVQACSEGAAVPPFWLSRSVAAETVCYYGSAKYAPSNLSIASARRHTAALCTPRCQVLGLLLPLTTTFLLATLN